MEQDKIINPQLTDFEKYVLFQKGTEPPFTGKYTDFFENGVYVCKNCGIPLYRSSDKFHSGCGWPSFDDEIPSAVKRKIDKDGIRTEISCSYCGAHLGHVFYGEGFTPKNVRHCVNSVSIQFIVESQKPRIDRIYFAAGCFWSVEHLFKTLKGVVDTDVGYMGGYEKNPTYEQVCTGTTGHAETVRVIFDPSKINIAELVKYFFEIHDFTQFDGQGPDIGGQYRSVIFYTNDEQKVVAESIRAQLCKRYVVSTSIEQAKEFYMAERYHQDYYEKTGRASYCHFKRGVFDTPDLT